MGTLYRRKQKMPDGTWRELPTWWLKYYQNGRQVVESSGTEKETVARRMLRTREGDVEHGIPINPKVGRVTFEDAADDIRNDYKANHRKSIANLEQRLRLHLGPYFRGRLLASITTADVRAYVAHRQQQGVIKRTGKRKDGPTGERIRDVANAEINNDLKVLSRMFSLAIEAGKLVYKPRIPLLKESNARAGFFEAEQFEAVCRHLPGHLRPLATFMYLTGWRRGEVRRLEWRQVDFTAGEVRLDPGTTKNDDGRVFPFTTALRELLEAQRDERDRLKKAGTIVPWVFWRLRGKRGSRTARRASQKPRPIGDFKKTWDAACRAAGCPGRYVHDFRRTAVRAFVRAGIPERVAMQLTGHKTRSVFERYNIVSPGDLRDAARKLDQARQLHDGYKTGYNDEKTATAGAPSSSQVVDSNGAGDGDRTRDIELGNTPKPEK
jgi:integrase